MTNSLFSVVRVVVEGAPWLTSSSKSSSGTPAVVSALAVVLLISSVPVLPPRGSLGCAAWVALVDRAEAAPDAPAGLPLGAAGAGRVTTAGARGITAGDAVDRAEA